MNFAESTRYLLGLGAETVAMKLGLSNITRLLERLGSPESAYPKIQIAGTNGKGSVAAMLASITRAANIRTGLYTSPHLVSITERIRLDDADISPDEFALHASTVQRAAEEMAAETGARPTFFEQVTAIALVAFRHHKIELAILETGLGGRLDATTAARAETVALTPISLDHEEYLGTTLAQVAAEKAAIIRPGVTVCLTAEQKSEAYDVVKRRAYECGVELRVAAGSVVEHEVSDTGRFVVTLKTRNGIYERVRVSLRGRHQIQNALLAVNIAETLANQNRKITPNEIKRGLETSRHPGRIELVTPDDDTAPILYDGAHNADGAASLASFLKEFVPQPLTLVFGAMSDKDLTGITSSLFPLASQIVLTRVDNPRAASLNTLSQLVTSKDATRVTYADNAFIALETASRISPPDGMICVTGSLYLVGEIKRHVRTAPNSLGDFHVQKS